MHDGHWHVSIGVPKPLRDQLDSHLSRSLGTESQTAARTLKLPVVREFKRKIEQAWEARGGRKRSPYAEATEMRNILEECSPDSDVYDEIAQSIRERVEEIRRDHMERTEHDEEERAYTDGDVQRLLMGKPVEGDSFLDIDLRVGECADGWFTFEPQKREKSSRDVPIHPDLVPLVTRRIKGNGQNKDLFEE